MSVSLGCREHTRPAVSPKVNERDTSPAPQSVSDPDSEVLAAQSVSPTMRGHVGTDRRPPRPLRVPEGGGYEITPPGRRADASTHVLLGDEREIERVEQE
jgi:hypothetical protein